MPFQFGLNSTALEVYVNEPADCRWSKEDKDYSLMENSMSCSSHVWEMNANLLYKCTTILTGLENKKDNVFYFRCKDQPLAPESERYVNTESYEFTLIGTQPLDILNVAPNETIKGYADVIGVNLQVETDNGYNHGDAICYYSETGKENDWIKMYETGTNIHKQRQDLIPGSYKYYFKCVDLGGNADSEETEFTIVVDRNAPQVVRVYNEGGTLKLETDEDSTCSYSNNLNQKCNFILDEGTFMLYSNTTEHYAEWKPNTNYYVKCRDDSGNEPNPSECSIIVRPYNILS